MEDDDPHHAATSAMTSKVKGQGRKVKVARSRDQSEPSWSNALPMSSPVGAYRVGRTRRPHVLWDQTVQSSKDNAGWNDNVLPVRNICQLNSIYLYGTSLPVLSFRLRQYPSRSSVMQGHLTWTNVTSNITHLFHSILICKRFNKSWQVANDN